MRQYLKLVVHFPVRLGALLAALGAFYVFARVLLVHDVARHAADAVQRWPQRKVADAKTLVASVYLPLALFLLAAAAGVSAAVNGDAVKLLCVAAPLPLLLCRRWLRVVGLPVYAFLVGLHEAVGAFHDSDRAESAAAGLVRSAVWDFILPVPYTGQGVLSRLGGWVLQLLPQPLWASSAVAYTRLSTELLVVVVACAVYSIALFCREPQHGASPSAISRGGDASNRFGAAVDGDELREAARNNDLARIKLLLARGVHADARSEDGSTALHVCAQQALSKGAQVLLDHSADANARDLLGFTPLHWAVQLRREEPSAFNRLDTIRVLMRHGADPKRRAVSGSTPLSIATRKENEAALEAIKDVIGPDQLERLADALM